MMVWVPSIDRAEAGGQALATEAGWCLRAVSAVEQGAS
jgi:hypothetical protein